MEDIRETLLAQYANSPALTGIIARFNEAADPRGLVETFLRDVWDPATATGWGLDVWGRIVGVPRTFLIDQNSYLGFASALPTAHALGEGIFYRGGDVTANFTLPDAQYRQLIFAKAAANISNGSTASINDILMTVFGRKGRCHVRDDGGMSLTVILEFLPDPVTLAILVGGIIPRPSGVAFNYFFIPALALKNDFAGDII